MKVNIFIAVCVIVLGLMAYDIARPKAQEQVQQSQPQSTELKTNDTPEVPVVADINILELWTLVNGYRTANGSESLRLNKNLEDSAYEKCDDLAQTGVWSHESKNGANYDVLIRSNGTKYLKAGENLAYGYESSYATFKGWQDSPTHDKNLLDPTYTDVGYAVCFADKIGDDINQLIIVQHLAR